MSYFLDCSILIEKTGFHLYSNSLQNDFSLGFSLPVYAHACVFSELPLVKLYSNFIAKNSTQCAAEYQMERVSFIFCVPFRTLPSTKKIHNNKKINIFECVILEYQSNFFLCEIAFINDFCCSMKDKRLDFTPILGVIVLYKLL